MAIAPSAPRPPFNLCAGHPVLDLVNSLDDRFGADEPRELLADYADLLRFAGQSGLLRPAGQRQLTKVGGAAGSKALSAAKQLREAAAAILYATVDGRAPNPTDLATLQHQFLDASRHRDLHWAGRSPPGKGAIEWSWERARGAAQLPVWLLADAANELLVAGPLDQVRACGVETCRWLFLDTSKNHTRRWCDMRVCGNRMKARRFLAKHEGSA